jgi:transposase-like protein
MLSFKGHHFPKAIKLMTVRWYVAYALRYRDIEELMNEREVKVDHATVQPRNRSWARKRCARY